MPKNMPVLDDDEALARALQEEYEREYRRRSMEQHLRQSQHQPQSSSQSQNRPPDYERSTGRIPSASAGPSTNRKSIRQSQPQSGQMRSLPRNSQPTRNPQTYGNQTISSRLSDEQYARFLEQQLQEGGPVSQHQLQTRPPTNTNSVQRSSASDRPVLLGGIPISAHRFDLELTDEEYARQLEQILRAEEAEARRANQAQSASMTNNNVYSTSSPSDLRSTGVVPGDGLVVGGRVLTDEEIAHRLAQEEEDAAFARSLRNAERQASIAVAQRPAPRKGCYLMGRLCNLLVVLCAVGIAVGLLWFYFGGSDGMPDFIPDPDLFRQEDPFSNTPPGDASAWPNDGKGLEMTMINALDEPWFNYFFKAVSDWDNGTPDSLTLKTENSDPESVCRVMAGYIKVCNGNYGSTNWRGINKVLLENGYIYASAARMNEFYFTQDDEYQRQYTMCHEIGHGFGLPHTDEIFGNKDLGNCMDYTNNPEANMHPDESNYELLANLYGSLDGSWVPNATDVIEASETVPAGEPSDGGQEEGPEKEKNEKDDKKGKEEPGKRWLRDMEISNDRYSQREKVMQIAHEMDSLIDAGAYKSADEYGWRRLHSNSHGEAYEVDLGDGFLIRFHMLLIPKN